MKITYEADTYRFGEIYRSVRGTSIEVCAQMCRGDGNCAAWSLTPATFQIGPRCELKTAPGAASHRPGAASGISEYWQMDPNRHADMRYRTSVPASRQPAAVPLDQLRPSPVPRVFGDPPPVREPELMGGPKTRISAVMRPPAAPTATAPDVIMVPAAPAAAAPMTQTVQAPTAPVTRAPSQTVEVLRGPAQGSAPNYVKQPAPAEPHPLYRAPKRASAPANSRTVFKDPSRRAAPAQPVAADYNAVLKRESQTPTPQKAAATPNIEPVQRIPAPRAPWTERVGNAPDYSVGGSNFVPGDEDATAGYVEGVPEAGT